MSMLRTTFYSYKGGVGRTLSLLNVAAILASNKRRVVVVDLDLEAPGIGLSRSTRGPTPPRGGVADFLLDRRQGENAPLDEYSYITLKNRCLDRLRIIPAGSPSRIAKLVAHLSNYYKDPASDAADIFQLLVAAINAEFSPDYLLIDSRTGLAEISGVCTVELPHLLVAVAGLNDQNVYGMRDALRLIHGHPARDQEVPTILVLSPIPREADLDDALPTIRQHLSDTEGAPDKQRFDAHPLLRSIYRAHIELLRPAALANSRRLFPGLSRDDMVHHIFYDPHVPLLDSEFIFDRMNSRLYESYYRLARTLSAAHPEDESLPARDELIDDVPVLHPSWND